MSNKFERMKGLQGLASNPPQPMAALTDERMRDEVQRMRRSIDGFARLKNAEPTDADLDGLFEDESGNEQS